MKTYTVTIDKSGTKRWYIDGKLHREDGPAIEYADGDKYWYFKRKRHREDGPAIEWANGDRYWYIHGKLHREDGPALERAGGYEAWYINGSELTQEQFNQRTAKNLTPSVKVVEIDGVKYELKKID
jgi:phage terminase Nu1 subunit (DNA packaging protein)